MSNQITKYENKDHSTTASPTQASDTGLPERDASDIKPFK
jgi:hypothetical protein